MKFIPVLLFAILYSFIGTPSLNGQGISEPGMYVRETLPPPQTYQLDPSSAFIVKYFLPQLLDASSVDKLKQEVAEINAALPKKPLAIDDCIYFNAFAKDVIEGDAANFISSETSYSDFFSSAFPPSLRFSTDETKNFVDSLFCMHLFPKVQLKKYAEPFYFKKTEVSNREYREFVSYVIDSIVRRALVDNGFEKYLLSEEDICPSGEMNIDSIAQIGYWPLNMKTEVNWNSDDPDYRYSLNTICLPEEERFYHRKEIDSRKINYVYFTTELGEKVKHTINIYPDTLCWSHDFSHYYEPIANLYSWHPAYTNYPVVGVSFQQAKAFLHWKTETEQKKLNAKGIKYNVEYDLPSEIEWETAATSYKEIKNITSSRKYFGALADGSWITDLMLDSSMLIDKKVKVIVDSIVTEVKPHDFDFTDGIYLKGPTPKYMRYLDSVFYKDGKEYNLRMGWYYWSAERKDFLNNNSISQGFFRTDYNTDFYSFTHPVDLTKTEKVTIGKYDHAERRHKYGEKKYTSNEVILSQLDNNDISFMGGNVSEWIDESYSDWLPAFLTRMRMLRSIDALDAQLEYQREFYYNSFNAKNGKLVRGANWFDERYGNFLDKNPAGTNAKIFVDPSKSHCTLGFRYVVHVKKK
jgi:formylglycine-generating enzyme required for sulfatase activity